MLAIALAAVLVLGHRSAAPTAQYFIEHMSVEHLEPETPGAALHGIDIQVPRFGWKLSECTHACMLCCTTGPCSFACLQRSNTHLLPHCVLLP
jgi:hypothetical protein